MLVAKSEVGMLVGVTIFAVSFWRMAERRGHGRGGHFASAPSAPLASSSHCPFSAKCPGLVRLCSTSSSMASWFLLGAALHGRLRWHPGACALHPLRSWLWRRLRRQVLVAIAFELFLQVFELGRSRGARECADHDGHLNRRLQWLVHCTSMTSCFVEKLKTI